MATLFILGLCIATSTQALRLDFVALSQVSHVASAQGLAQELVTWLAPLVL